MLIVATFPKDRRFSKDNQAFLQCPESLRKQPQFAALFDPQTCGGLLLGVSKNDTDAVVAELRRQSNVATEVIGEVCGSTSSHIELV